MSTKPKPDIVVQLRRLGAVTANWAAVDEAKARRLVRDAADEIECLRKVVQTYVADSTCVERNLGANCLK